MDVGTIEDFTPDRCGGGDESDLLGVAQGSQHLFQPCERARIAPGKLAQLSLLAVVECHGDPRQSPMPTKCAAEEPELNAAKEPSESSSGCVDTKSAYVVHLCSAPGPENPPSVKETS